MPDILPFDRPAPAAIRDVPLLSADLIREVLLAVITGDPVALTKRDRAGGTRRVLILARPDDYYASKDA